MTIFLVTVRSLQKEEIQPLSHDGDYAAIRLSQVSLFIRTLVEWFSYFSNLITPCPRLDIAVSKGMNHLLKAPFCIHPKTGRVCVPFNPSKVEKFDPTEVPTVLQLVEEIDKFTAGADEAMKKVKAYKKTSMKEPVAIFEEFLSNLGATWKGKLIEQSDSKMEF